MVGPGWLIVRTWDSLPDPVLKPRIVSTYGTMGRSSSSRPSERRVKSARRSRMTTGLLALSLGSELPRRSRTVGPLKMGVYRK